MQRLINTNYLGDYLTRYFKTFFLFSVLAIVFTSCSDDEPFNDIPWYEDIETLQADYAKAIIDAQKPEASEISTTLMPISENNKELEWITIDGKKMVLVCTMLNQSSLKYWTATDTFRLSKQTGLWVTLPQEWKHRSNQYIGMDSVASRFRMIQMLGLYPDCDYDTVVEFYVDASQLFRPSFDPSINTTSSGISFPAWANEQYLVGETKFREWFAYQSSIAYEGPYACPWTQLGYTYDWHRNAPRQGLSEYIATVNTLAKVKTRQGCWTFLRR